MFLLLRAPRGSALSEYPQADFGEHKRSLWMKGWTPPIPAPSSSCHGPQPRDTLRPEPGFGIGPGGRICPRPALAAALHLHNPEKSSARVLGIPPGPREGIQALAGLNSNTNCGCPPGMGIPTLLEAPQASSSGGRSSSGPCVWLCKGSLLWIKSQSTTGNCLWTAHPIPHFILGRGSVPTPSQRG